MGVLLHHTSEKERAFIVNFIGRLFSTCEKNISQHRYQQWDEKQGLKNSLIDQKKELTELLAQKNIIVFTNLKSRKESEIHL